MKRTVLAFSLAVGCSSAAMQPGEHVTAIWGSADSNVYAVGTHGLVLRYDGSAWTRGPAPTSADLLAVWGASATDVYVSGVDGLYHSVDNGITWTLVMPAGASK